MALKMDGATSTESEAAEVSEMLAANAWRALTASVMVADSVIVARGMNAALLVSVPVAVSARETGKMA